jgi:hypothetical protein
VALALVGLKLDGDGDLQLQGGLELKGGEVGGDRCELGVLEHGRRISPGNHPRLRTLHQPVSRRHRAQWALAMSRNEANQSVILVIC